MLREVHLVTIVPLRNDGQHKIAKRVKVALIYFRVNVYSLFNKNQTA